MSKLSKLCPMVATFVSALSLAPDANADTTEDAFHTIPKRESTLFEEAVAQGLITRDGLAKFLNNPDKDPRNMHFMKGGLDKRKLVEFIDKKVPLQHLTTLATSSSSKNEAEGGFNAGSHVSYSSVDIDNLLGKLPNPSDVDYYYPLMAEERPMNRIEELRPRAADFYEVGVALPTMKSEHFPYGGSRGPVQVKRVYLLDNNLGNPLLVATRHPSPSYSMHFTDPYNTFGDDFYDKYRGGNSSHSTFTVERELMEKPTVKQQNDLLEIAASDKEIAEKARAQILSRCEARKDDPTVKSVCDAIKGIREGKVSKIFPEGIVVSPGEADIREALKKVQETCSEDYVDYLISGTATGNDGACLLDGTNSVTGEECIKEPVDMDDPECNSGEPTSEQMDRLEQLIKDGKITLGQLHKLITNPGAYDACVEEGDAIEEEERDEDGSLNNISDFEVEGLIGYYHNNKGARGVGVDARMNIDYSIISRSICPSFDCSKLNNPDDYYMKAGKIGALFDGSFRYDAVDKSLAYTDIMAGEIKAMEGRGFCILDLMGANFVYRNDMYVPFEFTGAKISPMNIGFQGMPTDWMTLLTINGPAFYAGDGSLLGRNIGALLAYESQLDYTFDIDFAKLAGSTSVGLSMTFGDDSIDDDRHDAVRFVELESGLGMEEIGGTPFGVSYNYAMRYLWHKDWIAAGASGDQWLHQHLVGLGLKL